MLKIKQSIKKLKLKLIGPNRSRLAYFYDVIATLISSSLIYLLLRGLQLDAEISLMSGLVVTVFAFLVQAIVSYNYRTYRASWLYISNNDLIKLVKSIGLTSSVMLLAVFFIFKSFSISLIYSVSFFLMTVVFKLLPRIIYQYLGESRSKFRLDAKRVLVVGCGQGGVEIVRSMLLRQRPKFYKPIAFVDDNSGLIGKEILGVRVEGVINVIPELVKSHSIDLVVITIPSLAAKKMRKIVALCDQSRVPFCKIPSLNELTKPNSQELNFKCLSLEDLIGREQLSLEWDDIYQEINGKVVLITGGGGSIGAELSRQVLKLRPKKIIIVDNSEFNLYSIEQEIRKDKYFQEIDIRLVNVSERNAVRKVFTDTQPEIVFHAAAYKHVPLLESEICEAVRNNVLGTQVVAEESVNCKAEKFILISTDKAVNPSSFMGVTKRVAEIFCQTYNSVSETKFITVRFGNVLGSAGSVVPLFNHQIEEGGPVTVTHPDVERYFMTISEACQLILQASVIGDGGEIFVLDMGEAIKIDYLARKMIQLAGKSNPDQIKIIYTGLRPGEKLQEEFFYQNEESLKTSHSKIMKAMSVSYDPSFVFSLFEQFNEGYAAYDAQAVLNVVYKLIPDYQYESESLSSNMTVAI